MHINGILRVSAVCMGLFLMGMGGCSKINQDNYDKLSVGMGYTEVVELLGNPDICKDLPNTRSCIWGDANRQINVSFIGSKAVFHTGMGFSS